jgi:hypothetical protein
MYTLPLKPGAEASTQLSGPKPFIMQVSCKKFDYTGKKGKKVFLIYKEI